MNSGRGNTREGSEDSKKKFDRHSLFVERAGRFGRWFDEVKFTNLSGRDEDHDTETPIKLKIN